MDKGEERGDVFGEGLEWEEVSNGCPERCRYITVVAPDDGPPKFKELVLWDGEAGGSAEVA